jgi:hypothetical protein
VPLVPHVIEPLAGPIVAGWPYTSQVYLWNVSFSRLPSES